jgi:hypothetical protein
MLLIEHLNHLRPAMVEAAQEVYDSWEQNAEGLDELRGSGGICDEIADEIGAVLNLAGITATNGGQPGDDHAFLIAYDTKYAFVVDIPYSVYETGGGYNWKKKPGIIFKESDILIYMCERPDPNELEW